MKINLFVLGLGKDVDTIKVLELFSLYGTVDAIHLPTDKQTGAMLGYGFVQMTEQTGAGRAIAALDGSIFNGKKLNVRIADKKVKEPAASTNHRQQKPGQHQNNPQAQRIMRPRNSSIKIKANHSDQADKSPGNCK